MRLLILIFLSLCSQTNFFAQRGEDYYGYNPNYRGSRSNLDCSQPTNSTCNSLLNPTFNNVNGNNNAIVNAFPDEKVLDWHGSQGTADLNRWLGNTPPSLYPLYNFANLGAEQGMQQSGPKTFNEGIFTKIKNTDAQSNYLLSFFRSVTPVYSTPFKKFTLKIVLAKCSEFPSWSAGIGPTVYPAHYQTVYCENLTSVAALNQVAIRFTANDKYDILWVFTESIIEDPIDEMKSSFLNFANPELIDVTNPAISINTQPDCATTLTADCGVTNAGYTWTNGLGTVIGTGQQINTNASINNGNITVSLTVPNAITTNNSCSINNPTISSSINIPLCASWPKHYSNWDLYSDWSDGVFGLRRVGNSDFVATVTGDFSSTLNHNGPTPNPSTGYFTVHYNSSTSVSNWVQPNLVPVFALSNGTVQLASLNNPFVTSFHNSLTGAISTGPSFIPTSERILAEVNSGTFITLSSTDILLRTSTLTSSYSFQNVYPHIGNSYFNPTSNTLFVSYMDAQFNYKCAVFKIVNGIITLMANPNVYVVQVTNNDKIITVNYQGFLEEYDYTTASFTQLILPGITNSGINASRAQNQNTSDEILILQYLNNEINYVNLSSATKKTIIANQGVNISIGSHLIIGNQIIISGQNDAQNFNIGNQSFVSGGSLGIDPQFVSVFDLSSDFYRTNSNNGFSLELATNRKIIVSPNPARNFLNISLDKFYNSPNAKNIISISDSYGRAVIQKTANAKENKIDVSSLRQGIYHVSVLNTKGESVSATFIKE